jgi:Type I phosphodiesterase / nucleotide pyrophosphatase
MPERRAGEPEPSEEVRRLLAPHPTLGVPVPAYGGRSLPNVTASIARAAGHEPDGSRLPPLDPDLDPFDGRRSEGTAVLFLVDGLGFRALQRHAEGPFGSELPPPARRARPISSVFLTTTTVALTSLSTAAPPSWHGVVGHRQYLPRFGSVADLLRMSPIGIGASNDALVGSGWSPGTIAGVPSVFRRGVPGIALSRDRFANSGFTRILYDGAEYVAYSTLSDLGLLLREILEREPPPPLVFAYWDDLDTIHHLRGARDDLVDFEVGQVARVLAFARRGLSRSRAESTTVLLTADHGHVGVDPSHELCVDREPGILEHLLRPPGGDRRAALFAARPGHATALEAAIVERLPGGARAIPAEAAIEGGLFGPPPFHPELRDRIGDLIVLPAEPAGIAYTVPGRAGSSVRMRSAHGGLDPEELLVPLIAGSLEGWTQPSPRGDGDPGVRAPAGERGRAALRRPSSENP